MLKNSFFDRDQKIFGAAQAVDIMGVVGQGDGDKAKFEGALKLASIMHEVLSNTKFERVVFGPTVQLLTAFSDEAHLIQKGRNDGIESHRLRPFPENG